MPWSGRMSEPWKTIRADLCAMAAEDQVLREELAGDGSLFQGYHPRMEALHRRNAVRLEAILEHYGWPGRSNVGVEAADAAWLILQHAIAQPELQRRGLAILQAAATAGEVPQLQVAMLEDRIRTFEGRPQRYGTQFDWDENGQLSPLPLEDPEHVDERRRELGLGPLAEDVARRRAAIAQGPEQPPNDWAARRRAVEAWLRRVGWRS
jgi:hypothetical protein